MRKDELVNRKLNKSTHSASFCVRETKTHSHNLNSRKVSFLSRPQPFHTTCVSDAWVTARARARTKLATNQIGQPEEGEKKQIKISNLHTHTHRLNPSSHRLKIISISRASVKKFSLSRALTRSHALKPIVLRASRRHSRNTNTNTLTHSICQLHEKAMIAKILNRD